MRIGSTAHPGPAAGYEAKVLLHVGLGVGVAAVAGPAALVELLAPTQPDPLSGGHDPRRQGARYRGGSVPRPPPPSMGHALGTRVNAMPKIHMVDTGVGGWLLDAVPLDRLRA